jgi:hypothetical protein
LQRTPLLRLGARQLSWRDPPLSVRCRLLQRKSRRLKRRARAICSMSARLEVASRLSRVKEQDAPAQDAAPMLRGDPAREAGGGSAARIRGRRARSHGVLAIFCRRLGGERRFLGPRKCLKADGQRRGLSRRFVYILHGSLRPKTLRPTVHQRRDETRLHTITTG